MTARFGDGLPQASGSVAAEPTFEAQHVADAVRYMANLPLDTNVLFLTIAATKMPFVGRGLSCVAATGIVLSLWYAGILVQSWSGARRPAARSGRPAPRRAAVTSPLM
jgi:hypothetical protein